MAVSSVGGDSGRQQRGGHRPSEQHRDEEPLHDAVVVDDEGRRDHQQSGAATQATPTIRLTVASPGRFVLRSPLASRKNEMISITKPNSEACWWTQ